MDFCGDIIFAISDSRNLKVDFGMDFLPTRIITKGDLIVLGREAPVNRWLHCIKFDGENEFVVQLEKLLDILIKKIDHVNEYKMMYEDVYIRSELAEIGYSLPCSLVKKLAKVECNLNYSILSFGMAIYEN